MRTYLDYRISITGDRRVHVSYRPSRGGSTRDDGALIDAQSFEAARDLVARLESDQVAGSEIQQLGEAMCKSIFSPTLLAHLHDALREAGVVPDRGLRLRLDIDEAVSPLEAHLPWEYLRYPGDAYSSSFWFATHSQLVFSRYRPLREVSSALTLRADERLRILVAVASPVELPTVLYGPVWEKLLALTRDIPLLDAPNLLLAATAHTIDDALRAYQPHVVHVMAHGRFDGKDGQLALLSPRDQTAQWFGAEEFASLFETCTPGLVLLQSCESAQSSADVGFVGLASQIVHRNVPVVVAMRYPISNRLAIHFASEFYSSLVAGEPVDAAVQQGRRYIGRDYGHDTRSFGVPTLYMRVQEGRFFARAPRAPAEAHRASRVVGGQFQLEGPAATKKQTTIHVYNNLPRPRHDVFIGRLLEKRRLGEVLGPDAPYSLVVVEGTGGVGKTALALEFAHHYLRNCQQMPANERFAAIVWATAQTSLLTSSGLVSSAEVTSTLDDICTRICVVLQRQDILRAPRDVQRLMIEQVLSQCRTLIILDNADSITDARILPFLEQLPPPTKTLITSRYHIDAPVSIRLDRMAKGDALALVSNECDPTRCKLDKIRDRMLARIDRRITAGHHLERFRLAVGFSAGAIQQLLRQAQGDVVSFCFGRAIDQIRATDAYALLLASALFVSDVDCEAAAVVAGLGNDIIRRDQAAVALLRLNLVDKQGDRINVLPIVKRLLASESARLPVFLEEAGHRLVLWTARFLQTHNPMQDISPATEPFWQELENIRGVVRWCYAKQRGDDLASIAAYSGGCFFVYGLWQEMFELSSWGAEAAHTAKAWEATARASYEPILAHIEQGQIEKAERCLGLMAEGIDHMEAVPDDLMECFLYGKAVIASAKDQPDVRERFDEVLKLARKMGSPWREAGVFYGLGVWAYRKMHWSEAETSFAKVLDIAEKSGDSRSAALGYDYMPRFLVRRGDLSGAYALYHKGMGAVASHGEAISRANFALGLAQIAYQLGYLQEALQSAQHAHDLFSHLGIRKSLEESDLLLGQLRDRLASQADRS